MSGNDIYSKCLAVDEYAPFPSVARHTERCCIPSSLCCRRLWSVSSSTLTLPCGRLTSSRYCLWDEKRRNWQKSRTHEQLDQFLLSKCFSLIMKFHVNSLFISTFHKLLVFLHNPLMTAIPCL